MTTWNTIGAMVLVTSAMAAGVAAYGTPEGATPALAQAKDADKAALEKVIIANEQKINEAVAKGDVSAFKALVTADGWSLDANGPMSVTDFEKNLKQVKIEAGWKISDTRVVWIASGTAVLLYKWTGSGTFMGQPLPSVAFVSTVWHRNGTKWVAAFHQESAAAPGK
jgi:hypothetical protein